MAKRFDRIDQAHRRGVYGDPELPGYTRLQRIAYKLGAYTSRMVAKDNQVLHGYHEKRFETALANSAGLNIAVMNVLKQASRIPNQASSDPLRGYISRESDGSNPVQGWLSQLSSARSAQGESSMSTPIIGNIGALRIETFKPERTSPYLFYEQPVNSMTISCKAPVQADETLGPASTELWINNEETTEGVREAKPAMVAIDTAGNLTEVRVFSSKLNQWIDNSGALIHTNLEEVLDDVRSAAEQTATAYEEFGNIG